MQYFIIALVATLVFGIIGLTIYGLVLGFSAHVLVGLLHLVITPLSFITGFTEFFFSYDIGQAIVEAFQ